VQIHGENHRAPTFIARYEGVPTISDYEVAIQIIDALRRSYENWRRIHQPGRNDENRFTLWITGFSEHADRSGSTEDAQTFPIDHLSGSKLLAIKDFLANSSLEIDLKQATILLGLIPAPRHYGGKQKGRVIGATTYNKILLDWNINDDAKFLHNGVSVEINCVLFAVMAFLVRKNYPQESTKQRTIWECRNVILNMEERGYSLKKWMTYPELVKVFDSLQILVDYRIVMMRTEHLRCGAINDGAIKMRNDNTWEGCNFRNKFGSIFARNPTRMTDTRKPDLKAVKDHTIIIHYTDSKNPFNHANLIGTFF
jgi:hypothetical protein